MIVKAAKRYMELSDKEKAEEKSAGPFWDYLEIMVNGVSYSIIFEHNRAYGVDFIRQWMIDGNTESGVYWKYPELEGTVTFDCSNSLVGKREFENGSITWEFLLKPLGLHWGEIYKMSPYMMMGKHELIKALTDYGVAFGIVKEGTY